MTRVTATALPAPAFGGDELVRPNRPYNVGIAVRAPAALGAALNDNVPSLASIVPIGLVTLFMLWVVISPL